MSQKIPGDSAQKGFAVGRGLLAAAETLNYSMGEHSSNSLYGSTSRPMSNMARGPGGGQGKDHDPQLSRRVGSHLSNTMKLFASLGLSPTDLDELAQVPEENISVETLPNLIMQLKNRKVEASRRMSGDPRDMSALSPETSYRPSRDNWGDMQEGHLDPSMGQATGRGAQGDFGYGSMQDMSSRGYDRIDYGHTGASNGNRDRQYSELSHDSYRGLGMGSSSTPDSMLMQRRMGSPSQGKVQDFLGVMPHMFPHVCSLCDFDVHSTMEWNQHTNGLRHSENCRLLLQMYPDWDPHMPSTRVSGPHPMDTPNRSDGLLGAAPRGPGLQRGGMSSGWGSDSGYGFSNKSQSLPGPGKVRRGRVVVIKYDRKPLSSNSLFALAKPFGTIREHLVLKKKAFLEMATHEEALAVAEFYQRKPAIVHGKEVQVYLSREIAVIDKSQNEKEPTDPKGRQSQVVFFSNLPRDHEKKSELLTVARRFGTVEKHLFLNGEAFIQMETPDDAEMLVKYYTLNPLTIRGKSIRLNICTKYKTLTVNPGRGGQGRDRKGNSSISKTSSKSQRSSTASKGKESTSEKADTSQAAEEEDDAQAEGSGDEVAGVMEGDDQEEGDQDPDQDVQMEEPAEAEKAGQPESEENAEEEGDVKPSGEVEGDEEADADAASQEKAQEEEKEGTAKDDAAQEEEEEEAEPSHSTETGKDTEANEGAQDDSVAEEPSEDQTGEPDFPENMDEFVTLDELADEDDGDRLDSKSRGRDSSGSSRKSGGLRVVNVVGFRRGIDYLDEILSLAKPFGKVVRHLVLNVRPEAFLELSNEQEARAMVSFYNSNVLPSVCGKAVKIYHSQTYATIQSGKVIYVGQIPYFKTSDATLLKIAEPFGKIRRYYMNRSRNECFIEMERGEDAEAMAEAYKNNPPKFQGKRLTVYMSRKYKQLKHGHRPPSPEPEEKRPPKRERTAADGQNTGDSPVKAAAKKDEQPPAKKLKEDKEAEQPDTAQTSTAEVPSEQPEESEKEKEEEEGEDEGEAEKKEEKQDNTDDQKINAEEDSKNGAVEPPPASSSEDAPKTEEAAPTEPAEKKPELTPLTLGAYEPNTPVGVEFVKMGYYCRVCFLFYSNEETAKKTHCSSKAHYEKLKKHLEKDKAKALSSGAKN
ncbi:matrin 3-like 1.2 [Alosa pseudoharengus]|uniref:matrin 3-like 1.2 n=1 Tax=Alosa pseudoharengus TaxID=34774 RepID=UPI003F891BD3